MSLAMDKYKMVREAQAQGARTLEELMELTEIQIENDEEKAKIEELLKNVCKCRKVSVEQVVASVRNGADTITKVAESTGATTACGRCKGIVSNIIETKR